MLKRLFLPVILISLFLLAGCAPKPQALRLGEPVWQDGEIHQFAVLDKDGQTVGTAYFRMQAGGEAVGPQGWTFGREISAAGVFETVQVELSMPGYRPVRSQMHRTIQDEGSEAVEAEFQGSTVQLTLTNRQQVTTYEQVNVPSDIRDERTLPMIVRTLPLEPGYATQLNSFLPVAGALEPVAVQVKKPEQVTVPAGSFDAWLVELKYPNSTTRLWIGQAPPYPLVKLENGLSRATFVLEVYTPGE